MEQKVIFAGTLLGNIGEFEAGEGTYVAEKGIFASVTGYPRTSTSLVRKIISVEKLLPEYDIIPDFLVPGKIVLAKVVYIKEDLALLRIIAVDNRPVDQQIEGVLRKKNIRSFEIDKVRLEDCVLPGDIVKAKVLSIGDTRKVFLTTEEDELGVVFARSEETGALMIPYDWKEMICPYSGIKESRKVARPEFDNFNPDEKDDNKMVEEKA